MRRLSLRALLQWGWRQRRRLVVLILFFLIGWGGKTLYDRLTASDAKWRAAMAAGDAAVVADEYDTACRSYHRAVGEARKFGKYDARLAKSLFADAKVLLRIAPTGYYDELYIANENPLRYEKKRIFEELRTYYDFSSIVRSFSDLGQLKIAESAITKAERELIEAQCIALRTNKLSEDEQIALFEQRARVCGAMAKGDETISLMKRCIALRKRFHGQNHPLVADSYIKLGNLYSFRWDRYACFSKAYQIYLHTPGPESRNLYYATYQLAENSSQDGTYRRQIGWWADTAQVLKEKFGPRNRSYIRALDRLGSYYDSAKRYREAEETLTLAAITEEYCMKGRRPNYSIRYFYQRRKEYEKEKLFYLRLLKIRSELFGSNSLRCAEIYSQLASYHSTHKNPIQQIEYQEKYNSLYDDDLITSAPYRRPNDVRYTRDSYISSENDLITLSRANHRPEYAVRAQARIKRLCTVGPQPVHVPRPAPAP